MEFKQWLFEKTLYHGTIVDFEPTIRKYGLQGGWHEPDKTFVGHMYDDYGDIKRTEDDDVVFMTDKQEIHKAVNAMTFQISRKLGRDFHDVSDNDIRNHGLLVIIKDEENSVPQYNPYDRQWASDNIPRGAEEGD